VASLIGLVMLIGIVVTNAIVLIDLVKQYRDRGVPMTEALKRGAIHRVRPILMTAIATILALLPMGIGITGEGGFISRPLAVVVIGGLFSSTAMTLLVLPAIYHLVESIGRRGETRVLED
ncbi:MAG TPA: efflux RND transporter permease subunit, partial [Beutenbergiaceae bacterium]|nr:efflux RND transporter permease subunit [Beutenbergiaceae bacterium]